MSFIVARIKFLFGDGICWCCCCRSHSFGTQQIPRVYAFSIYGYFNDRITAISIDKTQARRLCLKYSRNQLDLKCS